MTDDKLGPFRFLTLFFVTSLISLLIYPPCPRASNLDDREARSWPVMGTYAEVVLIPKNESDTDQRKEAFRRVRQVFDRVNRTMTVYRTNSDLNRLNRWAGHRSVSVDPWLAEVLRIGEEAHEVTDSAFTMNTLGYGIEKGLKPDLVNVTDGSDRGDWLRVQTLPSRAYLEFTGMGIDLGGIAKGFALDKASEVLESKGYNRYLLKLGRNLLAGDAPRGRAGWPVQIQEEDHPEPLENQSISVSRQGVRSDTGHVVDPGSGQEATFERWSAVQARKAVVADMASTVLLVDPSVKRAILRYYPSITWVKSGVLTE